MPKNQPGYRPLALSVETSGREGSAAIGIGEKILGEISFSGPLRHSTELFPAVVGLLANLARQAREIQHIYVSAGPGSFTGIRIAVAFAKTLHFANNAQVVAVNTMDIIADNATDYITLTAEPRTVRCRAKNAENAEKELKLNSANSAVKKTTIDRIATILDAKRRQFFIAVYKRLRDNNDIRHTTCDIRYTKQGIWKKVFPDSLMTAAEFVQRFSRKEPIGLLGEGLLYYSDDFKAPGIFILDRKYWLPQAGRLYRLGQQLAAKGKFTNPITLTPFYLRKPI